jgi:digeranylgeranylglycerophospholipid reductase
LRCREEQDVIVVGASVAGLFAAYRLAQAGVRVRVFEAEPELSPDARTLIVTPAWLRMVDFDVDEAVLNRTGTFELISRRASARVRLREPDVVLERARFMELLADQVVAAGGELLLDHRFEGLGEHQDFPLVRFRNGHGPEETGAATVIGADGVESALAAEVAAGDDLERVGIVQARVALPDDLPVDTVRCWFDRGSTRFFYWLIPESAKTGAVGLIAETEEEAGAALERFMVAEGLAAIEYQQAQVPMYPPRSRPTADLREGQALLVGDAAGQVKVTTVGGVVTGMGGAAAAARSILRGTSYAAEARALRWELQAHAGLRRLLDGFSNADYDRLLRLLNGPTRRVLRRYNRDELRRAIWRLVLAQPRWVTLGGRAFVQAILNA